MPQTGMYSTTQYTATSGPQITQTRRPIENEQLTPMAILFNKIYEDGTLPQE